MKQMMQLRMCALGILALGVLLAGCGSRPAPRTGLFLDISPNSMEQVDKDGVRIAVKAITQENAASFPGVYTDLAAQAPTGPTTIPWVDVNIPAFELTVLNTTGHILKLTRAVIRLQDNRGSIYEPSTKPDLETALEARAGKLAADQVTIDTGAAKGRISALQLLDQDLALLPGIPAKAYATFNYPDEAATFLAGRSSLRLMLYEIPVVTNEAGEVTRTANFEFLYDIHTRAIGATQ